MSMRKETNPNQRQVLIIVVMKKGFIILMVAFITLCVVMLHMSNFLVTYLLGELIGGIVMFGVSILVAFEIGYVYWALRMDNE